MKIQKRKIKAICRIAYSIFDTDYLGSKFT